MSIIVLVGLLFAGFFSVVVIFGIGAAIYEIYFVKQDPLTDRDYTRSKDWTQSQE